jgi:hypothetical protein
MSICPIWPGPVVTPPVGSSTWQYASWSKMACPLALSGGTCGATTGCSCPSPRCNIGAKPGGTRACRQSDGAFLDGALASFSDSVAADERSEGPSWMLSAVDHHAYKRMLSAVLAHDPTHDDLIALLARLQTALDDRDLVLHGSSNKCTTRGCLRRLYDSRWEDASRPGRVIVSRGNVAFTVQEALRRLRPLLGVAADHRRSTGQTHSG